MSISIVEFAKASHSQAVSTAAAKAIHSLAERRLTRFAWDWGLPTLAAMDGDRCVGFLMIKEDDSENVLEIVLAFAEPDHPTVLARLLARMRRRWAGTAFREVRFTYHAENALMRKAAKAVGAKVRSFNCAVPLKARTSPDADQIADRDRVFARARDIGRNESRDWEATLEQMSAERRRVRERVPESEAASGDSPASCRSPAESDPSLPPGPGSSASGESPPAPRGGSDA